MKFLPDIPKEEFPAQTLVLELYTEGGVRIKSEAPIMRHFTIGLERI